MKQQSISIGHGGLVIWLESLRRGSLKKCPAFGHKVSILHVSPVWFKCIQNAFHRTSQTFRSSSAIVGHTSGAHSLRCYEDPPFLFLSRHKSLRFQRCFQIWKESDVPHWKVGRIGNLLCVVLDRKSFDDVVGISGLISPTLWTCTNPPLKWNAISQCVFPLRKQFSTLLQDGLTWICRTFQIDPSLLFIHSPHELASISTDMWPYLQLFYHALIWFLPMVSSPNTCWIFWMAWACVSPSFWQIFIQYFCSMRLFNSDEWTLPLYTRIVTGENWSRLPMKKYSRRRWMGGVTSHLKDTTHTGLVWSGKIKSDTFECTL